MAGQRVLIAGYGYVGAALGESLIADGHAVWGLRRRARPDASGVIALEADLAMPSTLKALPEELDCLVYLASPAGSDDALYRAVYVEGLRNLLAALVQQRQRPRRIFFVSSTAVYGQAGGEWVDESSPTEPGFFGGRRLLEAERLLDASGFAATRVRFGGIYGPRRVGLIERVRNGRAVYRENPAQYTNRIHREDCAGALRHLLGLDAPLDLYLGVDSEPADEATVYRWLAGALGAPEPRPAPSDAARERGNKRCRNGRLLASGYVLRHPTFREGYTALLSAPPR